MASARNAKKRLAAAVAHLLLSPSVLPDPLHTPFGPTTLDVLGPVLAVTLLLGWYASVPGAPRAERRGAAFVAGWLGALAFGRGGVALEASFAATLSGLGEFWGGAVSPAAATLGALLGIAAVAPSPLATGDALAPAGLVPVAGVALLDATRAADADDSARFVAELALALTALALFAWLWRRTPAFLARAGRRATLVATFVVASSVALDGLRHPPGLGLRRALTAGMALGLLAAALRLGPRAPQPTTA